LGGNNLLGAWLWDGEEVKEKKLKKKKKKKEKKKKRAPARWFNSIRSRVCKTSASPWIYMQNSSHNRRKMLGI
jgi:hypothetical protein